MGNEYEQRTRNAFTAKDASELLQPGALTPEGQVALYEMEDKSAPLTREQAMKWVRPRHMTAEGSQLLREGFGTDPVTNAEMKGLLAQGRSWTPEGAMTVSSRVNLPNAINAAQQVIDRQYPPRGNGQMLVRPPLSQEGPSRAAIEDAEAERVRAKTKDDIGLRDLLLGQYQQNAASRNDEDMFRAFRKSDEVANNNAAMAAVLMSRGVTPALAEALLKLNDSNNNTQNNDADRYQRGYANIRSTDQSGANTALSALAQMYGIDKTAEGAAATAAATSKEAQLKGEQAQMDSFLDYAASRLDVDPVQALRNPLTFTTILDEYNKMFRYFHGGRPLEPAASGGSKDGGLVRGYADGGQVDPMADALAMAMADPVAEGAPAAMETGDYVIPADVLRFYGLKFFQGMIQKAEEAELA